jgi:hypothetical protein
MRCAASQTGEGFSPRMQTPHPALRATFSHKGRREERCALSAVMAGLDPAIHVFVAAIKNVDARDKPGHDVIP